MKPFVNLLGLSYRRRQRMRRSLRTWSLVWLAGLAAAAAAYGLAAQRSTSLQQQLLALERSAAPLERLQQEEAAIQDSLKATVVKGTVLGQVQGERPPLSLLGAVSQSAHGCQGRLVVRHLGFARKDCQPAEGKTSSSGKAQQPEPEKQEPWGCVTVSGSALDNVAVATFVVGLRESGLFRHVELKSSLRSLDGKREICSYVLECEI
jgi:Tfp pilus assembly protein PilN